jgi:3-hydroxy acid dehydrogenase / malonic semialdehyde reductase
MQDSRVLITGASSGIGEACARRFALAGASLVLWARRLERLQELASELGEQHGIQVTIERVDVRERAVVETAAAALLKGGAVPDILLNNAGLAAGLARLHEGDPDDWDRMIDTNVKGLLYVSRALLPAMVARGRGHVVNIGSTASHMVYPNGNVYNATKFAERALTQGMNMDLLGTPIRVSSVDPGFVKTEFSMVRFSGDAERAQAVYRGFRPLDPEDVAEAVFWLTSLPAHVNVLDMVIMPTAQRSVYAVHRE